MFFDLLFVDLFPYQYPDSGLTFFCISILYPPLITDMESQISGYQKGPVKYHMQLGL